MNDLRSSLQTYFGFSDFKDQQEDIITSVLNQQDTFVIMPTGGGKSLCYQLPALIMDGTAIVISPLIALMKNQVDAIRGYDDNDSIAHFLNSSLNKQQSNTVKQDIRAGRTKLLYIAPETLTKEENIEFFQEVPLSFVAVDEAHCISEWGHDFRPEYRRIRYMIDAIDQKIPIIALTATATPKVQSDILKNLDMTGVQTFVSSFNRTNLYYEVRLKSNKENTFKQIVQFIKSQANKSGIVYVQARKTTEELAQVLQVNGIKATAYHAGLDSNTRNKAQDDFLMQNVDVIVATIAFGMGIDKPDVRFVIHYDIPKSIENYYQETGRAGRDGLEGICLAFYSPKDIAKLEKFLRDKPVAEKELGMQLLIEMMGYVETAACRRKYLLHYFGEEYDDSSCTRMCDNCRYPKEKQDVTDDMKLAIQAVLDLKENYKGKMLVDYLLGTQNQDITSFKFDELANYAKGQGDGKDKIYWQSVFRQALLRNLLQKDVESYGVVKLTEDGHTFLADPYQISIPINNEFVPTDYVDDRQAGALDETLLSMLMDLRKKISKKENLPAYVIFQDPSLQDMATQYPITMDDMTKISGVSMGKARRYGKQFIALIQEYVEENEIERPEDFVVKSIAAKSKSKVNIIQGVDRKLPLEDISKSIDISVDELLDEMYIIVNSGTKLNIEYIIEDMVDEYSKDDIYDYFMEAESDSIEDAFNELAEDDITLEEIKLVRLQFMSEMAN